MNISPLFDQALREERDLLWFSELHLNVQDAVVDSQADWQACPTQTDVDLTEEPGYCKLATSGTYAITQASQNTGQQIGKWTAALGGQKYEYWVWQSFPVTGVGRKVTSIKVRISNPGAFAYPISIAIYDSTKTNNLCQQASAAVAAGYTGDVTVTFPNFPIEVGSYWLKIIGPSVSYANILSVYYQNTDVYSGGQCDIGGKVGSLIMFDVYTANVGDLYFTINMTAFVPTGLIKTAVLDLQTVPAYPVTLQLAAQVPIGCTLRTTAWGSTTGAFAGEETTYADIPDGYEFPAGLRFWKAQLELFSDSTLTQTPVVDMIEFQTPKDIVKLRQQSKPLLYADKALRDNYSPLMAASQYSASAIKVTERVASGGELSFTIVDPEGDTIKRIVADSPLKNHRAVVYLGSDMPGFGEAQLYRHFIGIVDTGNIKPRFTRAAYELSVKLKNPILELKRKIPVPSETGLLDSTAVYLSYDGTQVIDTMSDAIRGQAAIPARYVDTQAFTDARANIGDVDLGSPAFIVKRIAGSPDTRVKGPIDLVKVLEQLAVIADVYVFPNEDGQISVVKHDPAAASVATWADNPLVIEGQLATPIYDISDIDLGYADRLFNCAIMGCEWDGSGNDWADMGKVYSYVDTDSVEAFAPGAALYLSIMEKGLKEASQWLGPEAGYNGESIAQNLASRFARRFAFPPIILKGVIVPQSELVRGIGAVVSVISNEVAKYRARRIPASSPMKCMITELKPVTWQGRNMVQANLLELT